MNKAGLFSRREMIKSSVLAAGALSSITRSASPMSYREGDDPWRGLKVGVASYTLRKMSVEAAIKAIQRVGLKYVSIKDFHLPLKSTLEQRRAVAQKFKDAGITPLSCGNVSMENNQGNCSSALEEEIWLAPIQYVARRYNLSDVGLAKVMQEAQHSTAWAGLLGEEGRRVNPFRDSLRFRN
jgi:hypothetical protein